MKVTEDLLNTNLPTKNYKFKPEDDLIKSIEQLVVIHRESLTKDDPNDLNDQIRVRADKVSKPAKETFASKF